jgi:hypothetical protein
LVSIQKVSRKIEELIQGTILPFKPFKLAKIKEKLLKLFHALHKRLRFPVIFWLENELKQQQLSKNLYIMGVVTLYT